MDVELIADAIGVPVWALVPMALAAAAVLVFILDGLSLGDGQPASSVSLAEYIKVKHGVTDPIDRRQPILRCEFWKIKDRSVAQDAFGMAECECLSSG